MALLPWANLIHQGLSQFKASAANFCNSAMLLEGSTETSFSSPIRLMRRISKGSPFSSTLDSASTSSTPCGTCPSAAGLARAKRASISTANGLENASRKDDKGLNSLNRWKPSSTVTLLKVCDGYLPCINLSKHTSHGFRMAAGKPSKTGSHNSVDYRETTQHHSFAKTNHYPLVIERSYGKLTIKRVIYLLTMVIFNSDVTVYQRICLFLKNYRCNCSSEVSPKSSNCGYHM